MDGSDKKQNSWRRHVSKINEQGGDMAGDAATPAKPKRHMRDVVKEVAANTGIQGIPNIQRAGSGCRKVFWIAVVVIGTAMLVWQVTEAFMKYYKYPTKTSMDLLYAPQLTFPAVTLCNMNPIRSSAVDGSSELGTLLDGLERNSTTNTEQPSSFFDWDTAEQVEDYFDLETQEFQNLANFLYLMSEVPRADRIAMGHNMTWMLLDCTFGGKSCSPTNFTLFQNYLYGNCFTFNAHGGTSSTALKSTKVGPMYGLSMEIYVDQLEYLQDLSDAAGVRLVIHNQTRMPFPEDEGFSIMPGTRTSVGIERVEIRRAEPPYGTCANVTEAMNEERNAFLAELNMIGYSEQACKKTCYQKYLITECECYDSNYPYEESIVAFRGLYNSSEGIWSCDKTGAAYEDETDCVNNVTAKYVSDTLGCSSICPPACMQVYYKRSMSQAMWPSSVDQEAALDVLLERDQILWDLLDGYSDSVAIDYVKENVLKIDVYYKDLNFETITTEKAYDWKDLLADLGGNAGLWLGVSVVALFELVEFLCDLVLVMFKKKTAKNAVTAVDDKTNLADI